RYGAHRRVTDGGIPLATGSGKTRRRLGTVLAARGPPAPAPLAALAARIRPGPPEDAAAEAGDTGTRALAARGPERLGLARTRRRVGIPRHAHLRREAGRAAVALLAAVLAHRPGDALEVSGGRGGLPIVVVHVDRRIAAGALRL